MRKSELYARYQNFRNDMEEISAEDFYTQLRNASKEDVSHNVYGSTETMEVRTDGARYISYSSLWNVGWQGDVDSDQFYCVIHGITKAEMEEMSKIFC